MFTFKRLVLSTSLPLILILFLAKPDIIYSQGCSSENIAAKYWQYKKNLTKHFMLVDRDLVNGCINDGIGQDEEDLCSCSKSGYSLPATSIDQVKNGSYALGDRNLSETNPEWYDPNCAKAGPSPGTHDYDNLTHNVLSVGSETPHQMGWYWVTLATEYKLLKNNGQTDEAQRTLEDLFLGLQAYRRLDITANCLAKERYDEIENNFETVDDCSVNVFGTGWYPGSFKACLCDFKYTNNIDGGCEKANFDSPCNGNNICSFIPQTDGYSGFYIREDATQDLEILNDPTEDKWNIDAVQSDHALSLVPPCTSTFSPACYNVHRQNFMSQDGVIALMVGLAMIKRYIPADATVSTCDGQTYNVLSIATKIGKSLTNRIFDAYNNQISWPRSGFEDCCQKEVFFSSCEGGHALAISKGLKKSLSYLDAQKHNANFNELVAWGGLTGLVAGGNDNANFWIRLKAIGWDMGGDNEKNIFIGQSLLRNQEIYQIMNNLLYPSPPNLAISKSFFKDLLCSAPCGGPCKKEEQFDGTHVQEFECPNTPNWVGQRWESHTTGSDANRQFNGLDFMALYNLYLLQFPEEQTSYFNPEKPEGDVGLYNGNIGGPNLLCSGNSGTYSVLNIQPTEVQNLAWTTSSNLSVVNTSGLSATIQANSQTYAYQFVQASFEKKQVIKQYFNGEPGFYSPTWVDDGQGQGVGYYIYPGEWNSYGGVTDVCDITYRKPIHNEIPSYVISSEIDHCHANYLFHATPQGLTVPDATYAWTFIVHPNNTTTTTTFTATGKDAYITVIPYGPIPGNAGFIETKLVVTSACGTKQFNTFIQYWCNPNRQVIVYPNPTTNGSQVSVNITNSYVVPSTGINVRLIRTSTGSIQSTQQIYNNGATINTTGFPTGNYTVRIELEDSSLLTTTLIIN